MANVEHVLRFGFDIDSFTNRDRFTERFQSLRDSFPSGFSCDDGWNWAQRNRGRWSNWWNDWRSLQINNQSSHPVQLSARPGTLYLSPGESITINRTPLRMRARNGLRLRFSTRLSNHISTITIYDDGFDLS